MLSPSKAIEDLSVPTAPIYIILTHSHSLVDDEQPSAPALSIPSTSDSMDKPVGHNVVIHPSPESILMNPVIKKFVVVVDVYDTYIMCDAV